ncbi:neurocan core protein-like, partial [Osmerus eperlanus]|uniref:neurocan core protein-like n=1 Tax=Osmerus eperlanus TaxID=29151 RepID=UPI002E0FE94B
MAVQISELAVGQEDGAGGLVWAEPVVNMRKVTHKAIREELSNSVLLPCVFNLRTNPSHEPPRIKWTKVWGQRGSDGLQKEQSVLVAKDNVVKVKKAFQGRVTLPGYQDNRFNASLALSSLRSSDSGLYRCEVVVGINDEQDTVPLDVTGVVFHYRAPHDRYALSFPDARRVCLENSAVIATPGQLQATFADGYDNCDAGWLSDQTVRYPIQSPRPGCYGDREDSPGVRNYGNRSPDELFDVYCFAKQLQGEVFHSSVPERLSLATASTHCHTLGAQLATVGQLYLAWQAGLDQCDPGWLADGSVRYPINVPRRNCGGDDPGVRTVYHNPNRTGFPDTTALFDAFCYRELQTGIQGFEALGLGQLQTQPSEADSADPKPQHGDPKPQPSSWTGVVDLEKEGLRSLAREDESSEISEEHVVIHLRPGETSPGWDQNLDSQGGSAHEDAASVGGGHFGSSVSLPSPTASPTSHSHPTNSVLSNFVNSMMRPFRYWTGGLDTEEEALYMATATSLPEEKSGDDQMLAGTAKEVPIGGKGGASNQDNAVMGHRAGTQSVQTPSAGLGTPEEGLSELEREVVPLDPLVPAVSNRDRSDPHAQPGERPSVARTEAASSAPGGAPPSGAVGKTNPPSEADATRPQGPRGPASAPVPSSQLRWALKTMRRSKLGPPGNVAYVGKGSTWEPLEAKAGPLEVMTLPTTSRDNGENFSGEGRDQDQDQDGVKTPVTRTTTEHDRQTEAEGSGGEVEPRAPILRPTQDHTGAVTVAEHTTVSQWQLVDQPTTLPAGVPSPAREGPARPEGTGTAKEARGEILFVRRPTENLPSTSSRRDSSVGGSPGSGSSPTIRKQSWQNPQPRGTETHPSPEEATSSGFTSRPAAPMEPLTTVQSSTAQSLTTREPAAANATDGSSADSERDSTKEAPVSVAWVPEEQEKNRTVSATPQPDDRVESRSAVSESFVVGAGRPPVTTDKADQNPFVVIMPNWVFGLNPG